MDFDALAPLASKAKDAKFINSKSEKIMKYISELLQ